MLEYNGYGNWLETICVCNGLCAILYRHLWFYQLRLSGACQCTHFIDPRMYIFP